MFMKQLNEIIGQISLPIKNMGYKKRRNAWYKEKDTLTVVLSIQKSQYSADTWYYLFGICLHEIAEKGNQSINNCQIQYRVDNRINDVEISSDNIVRLLKRWEEMYGDLRLLRLCAVQGNLPGQYTKKAVHFLTSVDLTNI